MNESLAHPDPAVRELLQQAKADAWDEGAHATRTFRVRWLMGNRVASEPTNPYRSAS